MSVQPWTNRKSVLAMPNLNRLLVDRAKEILGIIAANGDSHREIAAMSEYVEADYHGRFLVELLQNANDQAIKGGVSDSIVTIVRDHGILAVGNQGEPFDVRGIRSITSLGLSAKDPNELIGNKGIGFKAVFEISRCPEIYSAPARSATYRCRGANAFRVSLTPFEGLAGEERLASIVEAALREKPEDAKHLGPEGARRLAEEIGKAAPFKFPIELDLSDLEQRLSVVDCIPAETQTLLILPLVASDEVDDAISAALDELIAGNGAIILFLKGIGAVTLVDKCRGSTITIRKERRATTVVDAAATHLRITTTVSSSLGESAAREWDVVESVCGGIERPEQAKELNIAARKLPGSSWDGVERIGVAVALPIPDGADGLPAGDGAGFICIGLPTKTTTGTRAWVHSHFFGTISRKDVDLRSCDFNRLLFAEAIRLHDVLIGRLRQSSALSERRLVTLAFDYTEGPLKDALFSVGGQASQQIVLLDNGESFASPEQVLVVDPDKMSIVSTILSASSGLAETPKLPELLLATHAGGLLRRLAGQPSSKVDREVDTMLRVGTDGVCALERAARAFRNRGIAFWESFLGYSLKLDPGFERLRGLKIIPVTTDRLATAADGVFLQPVAGEITEAFDENINPDAPVRDILSTLPARVIDRLNLLDAQCIQVRQPDGRRLTELASRISPESGGLVRRPLLAELFESALVPALDSLGTAPSDFVDGLSLLGLAGRWLVSMGEDGRKRISISKMKVPAVTQSAHGWRWVPAGDTYFGEGWLGGAEESLLRVAYGRRDGALLVPWKKISDAVPTAVREDWVRVLSIAGVNRRPRLLSSTRQIPAPLEAISYLELGVRVAGVCPIDGAKDYWAKYLDACRKRPCNVATRQLYAFDRVSWIDGLEDAETRNAVVKMVLRDPGQYESYTRCSLGRADNPNTNATTPESLWVHAIRTNDWEVIPARGRLRRPSECWQIAAGLDVTRQSRFDLLNGVDTEYADAARILKVLGVSDLENNPPVRSVLLELERLALRAGSEAGISRRMVRSLAEDLYGRVQRELREDSSESLDGIKFLPLIHSDYIVSVLVYEIQEAWFVDDTGRAAFVPEIESKLIWPFSQRLGFGRITTWLRRHLGPGAVRLTSETPVATGFIASSQRIALHEWIEQNVKNPQQVLTDLGCLIAFTETRDTGLKKEQFREQWSRLQRASVVVGRFSGDRGTRVFVDVVPGTGIDVQVSQELNVYAILCELWRLVGSSYQYVWELYCAELEKGDDRALLFLKDKGITDNDREDVEAAIGHTSLDRLHRTIAAVYTIRRLRDNESPEDFGRAHRNHASPFGRFLEWAGPPFSEPLIKEVLFETSEERAFIKLLQETGIPPVQWQESRELLGMGRYRFATSAALWSEIRAQIINILRASFARLPGTDLRAAREILTAIENIPEPMQVLEALPHFANIRDYLVGAASGLLLPTDARTASVALNRLEAVRSNQAAAANEIKLAEEPPDREVREFRDTSDGARAQQAEARFNAFVEVGSGLAVQLGEIVNGSKLRGSGNIAHLLQGYWANRFSMVPVFQAELRRQAPRTLEKLIESGAFRSDHAPNELRALFPELRQLEQVAQIDAPRSITLGVMEISANDVLKDVRQGSNGRVGTFLAEIAQRNVWDGSLMQVERALVENKIPARRAAPGARRGVATYESDSDKQLNGKLGEIFVFLVLKALGIPGFDSQCWKSTNRCEYTRYEDGDDTCGCDFIVRDEGGKLTGRLDSPLCLIEVKTSGTGIDGPFKISENEFARATEAHFSECEEYIILRVADVRTAPRIGDVIRDPYKLLTEKKLRFSGGDLTAHVGARC